MRGSKENERKQEAKEREARKREARKREVKKFWAPGFGQRKRGKVESKRQGSFRENR